MINFDLIERFFSSIAIVVIIFCFIFYFSQGRKKEVLHEKILMYSFASFWLSISLARIFYYFSDIFLEGTYSGDLSTLIESYDLLNYIILYFYLYSHIYILISIIALSVMFIWFSIKSKKEFQLVSSVVAIGFTIFLIGWVFETTALKQLNLIPPALPSIFIIAGTIIATIPLIVDIEFFSSKLINWLVLISIVLILLFFSLTIFTNLPLVLLSQIIILISTSVLIMVIIFVAFYIIKRIKVSEVQEIVPKEELKDFIKTFMKPATITIEEIQLYKEKGLCLVCKSKVTRLNYVCPKCYALYCLKCSRALTNLENSCWVCETPFDESKPMKKSK